MKYRYERHNTINTQIQTIYTLSTSLEAIFWSALPKNWLCPKAMLNQVTINVCSNVLVKQLLWPDGKLTFHPHSAPVPVCFYDGYWNTATDTFCTLGIIFIVLSLCLLILQTHTLLKKMAWTWCQFNKVIFYLLWYYQNNMCAQYKHSDTYMQK